MLLNGNSPVNIKLFLKTNYKDNYNGVTLHTQSPEPLVHKSGVKQ